MQVIEETLKVGPVTQEKKPSSWDLAQAALSRIAAALLAPDEQMLKEAAISGPFRSLAGAKVRLERHTVTVSIAAFVPPENPAKARDIYFWNVDVGQDVQASFAEVQAALQLPIPVENFTNLLAALIKREILNLKVFLPEPHPRPVTKPADTFVQPSDLGRVSFSPHDVTDAKIAPQQIVIIKPQRQKFLFHAAAAWNATERAATSVFVRTGGRCAKSWLLHLRDPAQDKSIILGVSRSCFKSTAHLQVLFEEKIGLKPLECLASAAVLFTTGRGFTIDRAHGENRGLVSAMSDKLSEIIGENVYDQSPDVGA